MYLLSILLSQTLPLWVVIVATLVSLFVSNFERLYSLFTNNDLKVKDIDIQVLSKENQELKNKLDEFVEQEIRFKSILEKCEQNRHEIEKEFQELTTQNKFLFSVIKVMTRKSPDSELSQIVTEVMDNPKL